MSISKILIAAAMLGVASASCPNDCSGKGKCGDHDMCTCYPGYQGLDCSERTCLFGRAWGDVAYDEELAHDYAECSNNGICDRKTGECTCNDGFSGDACRYSTCPNGCNGHGTCEYISEIASDTSIQYQANSDRSYIDWDSGKSRFCKCDGGWSGVDCSARMCPKGNDPLTTHTPDEVGGNTAEVQEIQTVQIQPHLYNDNNGVFVGLGGDFTLTYVDAYNQEWTTRPIRVTTVIAEPAANAGEIAVASTTTVTDTKRRFGIFELYDVIEFNGLVSGTTGTNGPVKTITQIDCGVGDAACTITVTPAFAATETGAANDNLVTITLVGSDAGEIGVKRMLMELPNQVIKDVVVDQTLAVDSNQFRITFSDAGNSGDQHALQCKVAACDTDGCQPRKKAIKGLYQVTVSNGVVATSNTVTSASNTLGNFVAGTIHVGAAAGTATGTAAGQLDFSGTTLTDQSSASLVISQMQDFTDDSVGEFPVLNGATNDNAVSITVTSVTSANQVNQLADSGSGIDTTKFAAGDRVSVKCTDSAYSITVTEAREATSANTGLSWTASTKTLAISGTGDFTATAFKEAGSATGRVITAGDTILVDCADTTMDDNDGTYTVASVAAQAIVVNEALTSGADKAPAADGNCVITVTPGVRMSAIDGYYNIDSVAAGAITLDRAIAAPPAIATASCIIKKIRDSPCTVVETRKGTSENYECSRRGNCDSQTGLCGCFAGYTGEDCSVQTVLV